MRQHRLAEQATHITLAKTPEGWSKTTIQPNSECLCSLCKPSNDKQWHLREGVNISQGKQTFMQGKKRQLPKSSQSNLYDSQGINKVGGKKALLTGRVVCHATYPEQENWQNKTLHSKQLLPLSPRAASASFVLCVEFKKPLLSKKTLIPRILKALQYNVVNIMANTISIPQQNNLLQKSQIVILTVEEIVSTSGRNVCRFVSDRNIKACTSSRQSRCLQGLGAVSVLLFYEL